MLKMSKTDDFSRYREIVKDAFYLKDPILLELFKKSLPPREAYYYFPKGDEIIYIHKKKPEKNVRRIHINVPFIEIEQKWLKEFKNIIDSHPENKIPDYWKEGFNLAYIYSTDCKLDKAYAE